MPGVMVLFFIRDYLQAESLSGLFLCLYFISGALMMTVWDRLAKRIGKEQASNGDSVHVGRATVGVVTSGMISPILNKNIALCRMDVKYSDIGTKIEIGKLDGHQKRIEAKVVKFPFYDPEKLKVKS